MPRKPAVGRTITFDPSTVTVAAAGLSTIVAEYSTGSPSRSIEVSGMLSGKPATAVWSPTGPRIGGSLMTRGRGQIGP